MTNQKTKNVRRYAHTRVKTTSLKGLICFMHGQTLSYIKKGMEEGTKRDIEKAQNLIFLLELAVNKNEEASKVLADLYAYCYYLLEKTDPKSVLAAKTIMETLAGAFNQLAKSR